MNCEVANTEPNKELTGAQHKHLDWDSIDWPELQKLVNRAQTRIARAALDSDLAKVKNLQRMLVHSFAAKAIAVRHVTSTTGGKTPGIDGEIWDTPQKKMSGVLGLTKKGYNPKPLKRVYIDKGKKDGSKRPLGIPTIYDRAMQRLYALALEPVAETWADRNSFGFRRKRSAKDACEKVFTALCRKNQAQWIIEADIKGFFDNISHQWMLDNIPMDKNILRKFLMAGYVDGNQLYPTEEGTPQGGNISPILANMTLDGLEHMLHDRYWRCSPTSQINVGYNRHKVHFVRFADDFIITGDTRETCEEILALIKPFLKERGVELSEEKTVITHIDDGFDFLGWNFRKYSGKLLIKPSKKSIKKVLRKVRDIINDNQTASQRELVRQLNPVIRGWRNYHNHVVATKAFGYVHNATFESLWHWAIRRHKSEGKRWIKDRYWHTVDNDKWVFYDDSDEIGKHNPRLIRISNTKIARHSKLQTSRNPFLDGEYFEKRALLLGAKRLTGKFKDIWHRQQGKCLYCNQPMFMDSIDIHHNWPATWGGADGVTNLVYLHRLCHKSYHTHFPIRRNATRGERLRYGPLKKLGTHEQAIRNTMEKSDA